MNCYFKLTLFIQLLLGCKHWVPGGEHGGFLFKNLENVLGNIFLVDNKAEHVLVEPLVGHYECAVEALQEEVRLLQLFIMCCK